MIFRVNFICTSSIRSRLRNRLVGFPVGPSCLTQRWPPRDKTLVLWEPLWYMTRKENALGRKNDTASGKGILIKGALYSRYYSSPTVSLVCVGQRSIRLATGDPRCDGSYIHGSVRSNVRAKHPTTRREWCPCQSRQSEKGNECDPSLSSLISNDNRIAPSLSLF